MKTITFRPLRRIKKTGKITVASYMQWRKVEASDHSNFNLFLLEDFNGMKEDEYVYNHKGEQLFWFNHLPENTPRTFITIEKMASLLQVPVEHLKGEEWKHCEPIGKGFDSSVRGFDCDGVPVFSHYAADYCAKYYSDMSQFHPLTVKTVMVWYGYFLYRLENSTLKIGTAK